MKGVLNTYYKIFFGLALALSLANGTSAQCSWTEIDFEGFEYDTEIPDLIPGTTYHVIPWTNGNQHSGLSYCYMNFVNNLPSGTLVYERFYDVCVGQEYQVSCWFQGVNNSFSNITLNVVDGNGLIMDTWSGQTISAVWTNFISNTVVPTTPTMSFQLVSDFAPGNNDMAFDDLSLSMCISPPSDEGTLSACSASPINLFDELTSLNGTGGTWSGPSVLTNGYQGTFDPNVNATGVYTYTITNTTPCPDSVANITVNVLPMPDINPIADVTNCGDFVLPPINGTNLSGAEAYYEGPGGTGNMYNEGDIISTNNTLYIYDGMPPCTDEESFTIIIYDPVVDLGPDLELCDGDEVLLDVFIPDATYTWQDNSNSPNFLVQSSGTYYVDVLLGGCLAQDTVEVQFHPSPQVDLGPDTSICENTSLLLIAVNAGASYQWQDLSQQPTFTVTDAGEYYVAVSIDGTGCIDTDTIHIAIHPLPSLDLGNDTLVCKSEQFRLKPIFEFTDSLVWPDGSLGEEFIPIAAATYFATAYNVCGSAYDEIVLEYEDCGCNIYIPNAMTPDGDGINDFFKPVISNCNFNRYSLTVFDSWGQVVFESTDPDATWNGSQAQNTDYYARDGVYLWVMTYDALVQGQFRSERNRGHITLVK